MVVVNKNSPARLPRAPSLPAPPAADVTRREAPPPQKQPDVVSRMRADAGRVARESVVRDAARDAMRTAMNARIPERRDVGPGDSGSDVEGLQSGLVQAGFMTNAQMATGPGIFGPQTEASVRALQTQAGLPVTGVVDAATRRALASLNNQQELRRGQTGNTVLALQDDLVKAGILTPAQVATGPGIFGPQTESAVRSAQERAGLPVTGVVDTATRRAIREQGRSAPSTEPSTEPSTGLSTEPSTPSDGAITTASAGNEHFLTQYVDPRWNPSGPNFSANCGPASVAIALSASGQMPAGLTPEQRVDYARALMNPGHPETTTISVNGRDVAQLDRDHDYSDQGQVSTAFQSLGGTGTHGAGWSSLDAALANGPVVLDGYYSKAGWGSVVEAAGARQGTPGRAGTGETGHLISVVGMTPDGQYLVADPMFTGGVVAMTRDELAVFCGDPTFVSFR